MNTKRAAGFLIFRRRLNQPIEYLLLCSRKRTAHWSPPKGTHMAEEIRAGYLGFIYARSDIKISENLSDFRVNRLFLFCSFK